MKSTLLLVLFLLNVGVSVIYAGNSSRRVQVGLDEIVPGRSISNTPKAEIDDLALQLTLTFEMPTDDYTVSITDAQGAVIFEEIYIANGTTEQNYAIPQLNSGMHTLTITSSGKTFSGEFEI